MTFLIGKWLKSIIKRLIQAGIAIVGAERLASLGVTLDPELLTIATFGVVEALRGWLKHKVGWKLL